MGAQGDYCPIAMGVDVLGDRWTPLVVRELMVGATGFNEIHRGVPRMSRTLLSQRLRQLERHGLVRREAAAPGRAGRYELTPAGCALTEVVWALGQWAAEWVFGDPSEEDCDGLSLLWRLHQHAVRDRLPAERTVVHVVLTGAGAAQGWLDVEPHGITVCRDDPGRQVDLLVEAGTAALQRWLLGLAPFREVVATGQVRLAGPGRLVREFPDWFDTSLFAEGLQRGADRRRREAAAAP